MHPSIKQVARTGLLCIALATGLVASASATESASLLQAAIPVSRLTAGQFNALLLSTPAGRQLLQIAGTPRCGINVLSYPYLTLGGRKEPTNATGAVLVPTGPAPGCSGPRPVVLYAHGSAMDRNYNMADLQRNDEAASIAAIYAAQGYIVVAPNYAGYGASLLDYHPYLNAEQQSHDMLDGLLGARLALSLHNIQQLLSAAPITRDNGKLFIAGYSQGGHVAMATQRLLQQLGIRVAAAAPSSGPYALQAFVDTLFYGNVNQPAPLMANLLANSYQRSYGIYGTASDFYEPGFVATAAGLLPSTTPLEIILQQGQLPLNQLFSSTPPTAPDPNLQPLLDSISPPPNNPLAALGFGSNNLVNNRYRLGYLLDALSNPDVSSGNPSGTPQHPMRLALQRNDLRSWRNGPARPTLLCGANADPTVYFLNTQLMQARWSGLPAGRLTTLDIDSTPAGTSDPFAPLKLGFAQTKAAIAAAAVAAGATDGGQAAVMGQYHFIAAPFCLAAARSFFQQVGGS